MGRSPEPRDLRTFGAVTLTDQPPLLHRPILHRLEGDASKPQSFQRWARVRELEIPEQPWNTGDSLTYERANASYLVDGRESDGFLLLVYAGSTELLSYGNRGHAKLGLARSRDLVTWEPAAAR